MSVRLTPRGTRGGAFRPAQMPRAVREIYKFMTVASFRLSRGRMKVQGRPLLLLETRGARSGKRRRATLGWFPDEDATRRAWLIVASAAGDAAHPAWYLNLVRRPEAYIDVAGQHIAVHAESLHGPERERAWARVVALAPGYGKYEHETDREIPILRLTPLSA